MEKEEKKETQKEEKIETKKVEKKEEKVEKKENFDFKSIFDTFVETIKGLFTNPVETLESITKDSKLVFGLISIVLVAISALIYNTALLYSIYDKLSKGWFDQSFDVMLYELAFLSVAALMIYLMANKVFKDKFSIQKSFALVGGIAVISTLANLISSIMILISDDIAIYVIKTAEIAFYILLYQGLLSTTKLKGNKMLCVILVSIIVALLTKNLLLPELFN